MKNMLFIFAFTVSLFAQYDWSTPKMLSNPAADPALDPKIFVDHAGILHAIWARYIFNGDLVEPAVIEYVRSDDNGTTWTSPIEITPIYSSDRIIEPQIVCDSNNNLHIVFYLVLSGKIYYMNNIGGSWSTPQYTGYTLVATPVLTIDKNDKLYYFYFSGTSLSGNSYYIYKDLGGSWSSRYSMPSKFRVKDAKCSNNILYVCGGILTDETDAYSGKAYVTSMDIATGIWTTPVDMSFDNFLTIIMSFDIKNDKLGLIYSHGEKADSERTTKYCETDLDFNIISDLDSVSYGLINSQIIIDTNDCPHILETKCEYYNYYLQDSFLENGTWYNYMIIGNNNQYDDYDEPCFAYNGIDVFYLVYNFKTQIYFQTKTHSGIDNQDYNIPKDLYLSNYPNPFNSTTEISFVLMDPEFVTLNLLNGKGELVKELTKKKYNSGKHNITLEMSNFESGVYFISLKSEKEKDTKKILYLK